jgi:predicted protein tyrosine phosphatase
MERTAVWIARTRPQKRIVVESVEGAYHFKCDVPWACISIVTSEGAWPPVNQANLLGHLQLAFADILPPDDPRAFKREHAHRILNFVRGIWDKIELLMVHCEAGVSRSPAVAAAISQIYLGTEGTFLMPHLYQPNRLVYAVLLETAWERGAYVG